VCLPQTVLIWPTHDVMTECCHAARHMTCLRPGQRCSTNNGTKHFVQFVHQRTLEAMSWVQYRWFLRCTAAVTPPQARTGSLVYRGTARMTPVHIPRVLPLDVPQHWQCMRNTLKCNTRIHIGDILSAVTQEATSSAFRQCRST
jgi:hypothetical protein